MSDCACQHADHASYRCGHCRQCFLCAHTTVRRTPPIWRCQDNTYILAAAEGQAYLDPTILDRLGTTPAD